LFCSPNENHTYSTHNISQLYHQNALGFLRQKPLDLAGPCRVAYPNVKLKRLGNVTDFLSASAKGGQWEKPWIFPTKHGGFPQSLEEWLGQAVNLNSKGVSTWNKRERISQSAAIQNISDTIMYIRMYKYMYIYMIVYILITCIYITI
jgi:hypothetical protein